MHKNSGTTLQRARTVAGCFISSLGCGTIYVYSAYSTQLAERLDLTATQSSVLGIMGPIGVALLSFFAGLIVDKLGLLVPCFLGTTFLCLGYSYVYHAYKYSISVVPLIAVALVVAGFGSTLTYNACVKCSALNFPHRRGTATSIPMSAFGLSAFLFSTVAGVAYPGDTNGFLKVLAILTTGLSVVCIPYMKVYDTEPQHDAESEDSLLPDGTSYSYGTGPSESSTIQYRSSQDSLSVSKQVDEQTALVPSESDLVDIPEQDIGGLQIVKSKEFWSKFVVMGLLTGPGQMYIYCVGYVVHALALSSDIDSPAKVQSFQALQVAIISVTNFSGRLLSGVVSDYLLHHYGLHRLWVLVMASGVGFVGSVLAMNVYQVHHMWIVSVVIGLSYGLFFGVYPSIITDSFGLSRFSSNWGLVSISQVVASYIYSLLFGKIYDSNSTDDHDASGAICYKGPGCYSTSFIITAATNVVTAITLLFMIYRHRRTLV
uniref:ARAD1A01606p n=1 Tax=Blastobotrys adeninivorans TaxID=409370 RepID=A0A060SWH2_BLAAD